MCSSKENRPYLPAQNEQERFLLKRVQELWNIAQQRGIPRYTGFLSSREQDLAQMALSKFGEGYRLWGGYQEAERKVLCLEPDGKVWGEPLSCVKIRCTGAKHSTVPEHKDYLGAILALGLERECIGDIVFDSEDQTVVYVPILERIQSLVCEELVSVGRWSVYVEPFEGEIPYKTPDRELKTATVSSLRIDSVLAAMLRSSRGQAAELIRSGLVSLNHMPVTSVSASVYQGDLFTARGYGRFRLESVGGKSRKDRLFIQFYQY